MPQPDTQRPLRIAQIAPLYEAVPPKKYGGTERVVSFLTEALLELGHEVTLFASGDSMTKAELVACSPVALRYATTVTAKPGEPLPPPLRDPNAPHMLMMEKVFRQADRFDVLHFHVDYWSYALFSRQPVPFLTTLHGRLDMHELKPIYDTYPDVNLVSISDAQRKPMPQANFIGTVHHGLPIDLLKPVTPTEAPYLAFLGRICPEKGPDRAIHIAREAGVKLKMAAKVDPVDVDYYTNYIRPMIDASPDVEFIGEIDDSEKPAFLSNSLAMISPMEMPEPFGLVMIEALACGVPVIVWRRGSVPEIVRHGETGFIIESEREGVEAVLKLKDLLSREQLRKEFETRFSSQRMASDYVNLYRGLIAKRG